jgi:hypothetical protein
MEKEKQLKMIGLGMCVPAVAMAIYIAFHLSFLVVAILTAVSAALCVYGIKLAKGATLAEVTDDIKDDIGKIK